MNQAFDQRGVSNLQIYTILKLMMDALTSVLWVSNLQIYTILKQP